MPLCPYFSLPNPALKYLLSVWNRSKPPRRGQPKRCCRALTTSPWVFPTCTGPQREGVLLPADMGTQRGDPQVGHLGCPPAAEGGSAQGNKERLERRLLPQNWSPAAILATCSGTGTQPCGAAQSVTKARAASDEQPREGSRRGHSAGKCQADTPQPDVTRRAGPLHIHPAVPVPSTAQHRSSPPAPALPAVPQQRAGTRGSSTEEPRRCRMGLGPARKPL